MATKTVKIQAGDSFDLPEGAKIISVFSESDNIEIDSECIVLPEIERYECFTLKWQIEYDLGHDRPNPPLFIPPVVHEAQTGPWNIFDMQLLEIGVAGQVYPIPNTAPNTITPDGQGGTGIIGPDPNKLKNFILYNIPNNYIIVKYLYFHFIGERKDLNFNFKAPTSIGPTVYFKFGGKGGVKETYVYAYSCDDCCDDGIDTEPFDI